MKIISKNIILPLIIFLRTVNSEMDLEKIKFCANLNCDEVVDQKVCGVRNEGGHLAVKLFDNECALLKYGCQVDDDKAYGIINMEFCRQPDKSNDLCDICPHRSKLNPVCGIRKDGKGFRIRLFSNECHLSKYNCETNLKFGVTEFYVCKDLTLEIKDVEFNETINRNGAAPNDKGTIQEREVPIKTIKNIVVVKGAMIDRNNINASIDNFFAATHLVNMPLKEIESPMDASGRRMRVKVFSPIMVYKPYVVIPKVIKDDHYHEPTLGSCFHKCPSKCPDTYAPVCGKPGIYPREPSLMFQNHCFMDIAQCKMYWEDKSPTSLSAYYIESAFVFCLGDELYNNYRFLPLVRTLQHMGRLQKKSTYRYWVKNMKFLNNMLKKEPNLMG